MTKNQKSFLSKNLARILSGYTWQQDSIGKSSASVFCLKAENKNTIYLKIAENSEELKREKLRLDWLKNFLPVPEVVFYEQFEDREYLLISEISGVCAVHESLGNSISEVIEEVVKGLASIHKISIKNCPFDFTLKRKLEIARRNMLNNLVDEEDFDDERAGKTAEDLFAELERERIKDEDLVFTHGDYCLPNIILKDKKLSGFIDWSSAGIADRYQDLALLTRSVRDNFGRGWEEKVFEIYGIKPDWNKINYYRLLDEFF